jgi:hypothetical protein
VKPAGRFRIELPDHTMVQVLALARPELLLEINAIALIS